MQGTCGNYVSGSSDKKTTFKETQPNSAQITPTKIQMRTFEITQYKISNNSGLKFNQIPKNCSRVPADRTDLSQYLALKSSNSKMHSLTDLGNGSQMDFQSVNRQ